MRPLPRPLLPVVVLAAALAPGQVLGQAGQPRKLGEFQGWIAAVYTDAGQKVCYAFARPLRGDGPAHPGVLLTVTHRPAARDTVTVSAGYAYPRNAAAVMSIGSTDLPFYTAGSTAVARDGAAVVRSLAAGREAVLKGPGANGRGQVALAFPLAGFAAAHDAIGRECPAGARR